MTGFVMAAVAMENTLYFSDRYSNGLYQLNLNNGEYSFVDYFYDEEMGEWLYSQAYLWEETIYFIPGLAEKIACFNTISKEMTYIELPEDGSVIHGVDGVFAEKFHCQRYKNILWMMPVGYNLFLKLDMSSGRLDKIKLPDCIEFKEGIFNWRTCSLYREELIFQPWAGTMQVRYDIVSGCFSTGKWEKEIRVYRCCLKNKSCEIYIPWELKYGILVKCEKNKKHICLLLDKNVKNDTCVITFWIANQLVLMPQYGHNIIVANIPNFNIEYIDLNKKFDKDYVSWEWINMAETEDKYYVFSSIISEILEIDRFNNDMKLVEIKKENCESKKRRYSRIAENLDRKIFQIGWEGIQYEKKIGLEQLIIQMAHQLKKGYIKQSHCGNIIYERLKV